MLWTRVFVLSAVLVFAFSTAVESVAVPVFAMPPQGPPPEKERTVAAPEEVFVEQPEASRILKGRARRSPYRSEYAEERAEAREWMEEIYDMMEDRREWSSRSVMVR